LSLQLAADERPGDKIPGVGYDAYKARLKNPSAGKGKSGGFRVIYFVEIANSVYLLTIYSKSEAVDVPAGEIKRLRNEILGDVSKTSDSEKE
jgi:mRNA-degrading endonuclease RelE of RelBE toxin-antitoxin system